MCVRDSKDEYFLLEAPVDDGEGELVKNVPAAGREIDRPAIRCFYDIGYGPLEFAFEIERSRRAPVRYTKRVTRDTLVLLPGES